MTALVSGAGTSKYRSTSIPRRPSALIFQTMFTRADEVIE
jgi:hypothetical protein